MPELPEVEITRRGIVPHVLGQRVEQVIIRQPKLRWPVPQILTTELAGQTIEDIVRRAKYLLLHTHRGCLILHLGMSGSLRVLPAAIPAGKHDHVDLVLANGVYLRLRDPRRFGAVLWTQEEVQKHPLLARLGPEPWDPGFSGVYLYGLARARSAAVKSLIMDAGVVVGVGNIYANEALFRAGIHPNREARRVSRQRYEVLVRAIRAVLEEAIQQGGTTLRDFTRSDGRPGYFAEALAIYQRAGQACGRCGATIRKLRSLQRTSFYCPHCQR
ncbi:MAG: bifunctional DNA-formamidopyrimidine glycosylase/DNA-(apurinic or apyrimidinic site) lyase [Gammaproteobacteria bacterium]